MKEGRKEERKKIGKRKMIEGKEEDWSKELYFQAKWWQKFDWLNRIQAQKESDLMKSKIQMQRIKS